MDELISFLRSYLDRYGRLVLVVGMELYEHAGIPVRIVRVTEEDELAFVSNRFEQQFYVNVHDLTLRPSPPSRENRFFKV